MRPPPQRPVARRRPPSPGVEVARITDPTAPGGSLEALDQDVVQLERRPLRARRLAVRLEDCLVIFHSTNLRMRVRTALQDDLLVFSVVGPRTAGTMNGVAVRPDQLLAATAASPFDIVAEPGYESVSILVPPAVMRSQLAGWRGWDALAPGEAQFLRVLAPRSRDLFEWGKRLAQLAARQPARFAHGRAAPATAKAALLRLLCAALEAAQAPRHGRGERTLQGQSRIVKLAEDYAAAHLGDHLYVEDLCVALGVSERTLEYAFARIMHMSPVAFLRRLRLHRVRQALRAATRGSTTVSIEALNGGFAHFGEFSRAYKDCFGELPSETLRRGADAPSADAGGAREAPRR
jgi:AraC family transcriptional regulator, ethanolamine operon transcriptional activator